jgi:hypothetical protein
MPPLPIHSKCLDALEVTYRKTEPTNIILTRDQFLVEMDAALL